MNYKKVEKYLKKNEISNDTIMNIFSPCNNLGSVSEKSRSLLT